MCIYCLLASLPPYDAFYNNTENHRKTHAQRTLDRHELGVVARRDAPHPGLHGSGVGGDSLEDGDDALFDVGLDAAIDDFHFERVGIDSHLT